MHYVCTFTDKNCIENILKVWLPTLQKNFSGNIVVIVFDVTKEHIEQLRNQGVTVIEEDYTISGLYNVVAKRLEAEEKFIKTLKIDDKIMLIDGADVVFQSDINDFFNKINNKIIYSTTGTLTNTSTRRWFDKLLKYSNDKTKIIESINKEEIKAAGMLAGKKYQFLRYFKRHRRAFKKFKVKYFTGINQAILTYLILEYPDDFQQTYIHNCRLLSKDVVKEDGIYKVHKTIPIIHFSCAKLKPIYKDNYLINNETTKSIKNNLNILWLYGSVPKFDVINHWYHGDFARIMSKMPNVNLMMYGLGMEEIYPDLAKISFNTKMTGLDIKKEFNFDVIIMDNKNRFVYSQTLAERKAGKHRTFWLKPEFFKSLDNTPKVFLEGDYHLHFRAHSEEKNWFRERKIDLLLIRHLSALDYHIDKTIPIKWFPCSVDVNVFKPNPDIIRKNKICLISGYGINYYNYRNTAGKILQSVDLIDIYTKRFIGDAYIENLQSYISHLSGSSIRAITAAKMFEIMASGSILLTDEGWEYGLKELFSDDSYCTYNKKDYSDVISKARKIINEPEFCKYTTTKALKCILEKHTHEIRAKELIDMIMKRFKISYSANKVNNKIIYKYPDKIDIPNQTEKQIINIKHGININNEKILEKLYNKGIKIYLLKKTCYEAIIDNKINDILNIAVDNEEDAKKVLGNDFIFNTIPTNTKSFIYKNMVLNVPYPVLNYLQKYYGSDCVKILKEKRKKLRLIKNTYKFIERK